MIPNQISFEVKLTPDAKGYIDRQCPSCGFVYKVNSEDWENITDQGDIFCPRCGYSANADDCLTDYQYDEALKRARDYVAGLVQGELDSMFSRLAKNVNSRRGPIRIEYKPSKPAIFRNYPIPQKPEWELEIECEKCGTRYSVIGSAFFCPSCGANAVSRVFSDSMETIGLMVSEADAIEFPGSVGRDQKVRIQQHIIETSIGEAVSAFQSFAYAVYTVHTGKAACPNDFQIVEKGNSMFSEISWPYNDWLSDAELRFMNIMFQRRHLIEHRGGIVDKKYLERTADQAYGQGQRIIISKSDALRFIDILKKLGTGIIEKMRETDGRQFKRVDDNG